MIKPLRRIRLSLGEIRHQELLDAGFAVIKREGLAGATVGKIAEEVGASKGIIHHYFTSKRGLVLATLRYAHALRSKEIVERLRAARSPYERLAAIIDVNFGPAYLNAEYCTLWVSCASEALRDKEFERLQRVIASRENSNLLHCLRQILPGEEAMSLLFGLRAMLQASRLWACYNRSFAATHARRLVYAFIQQKIPRFGAQVGD
jgi:TetR/AcrR family transcriptional repressor of bet genes